MTGGPTSPTGRPLGVVALVPLPLRAGHTERRHGHLREMEHHDGPPENRFPPVVVFPVRLMYGRQRAPDWMWAESPPDPGVYSVKPAGDGFATVWYGIPPAGECSARRFRGGYRAAHDALTHGFRPVFQPQGGIPTGAGPG